MPTAGEVRREFEARLLDDWHVLAVQLEIPEATKNTWDNGREAAGIWVWLAKKNRLGALAAALDEVQRGDLAESLRQVPLAELATFGSGEEPETLVGLRSLLTRWQFWLLIIVIGAGSISLWKTLFPAPRPSRSLPGELYTLVDSGAVLTEQYRGHQTNGMRALDDSVGALSDDGWFGYVFVSKPIPESYTHPTATVEIRDAAGNLVRNTTDLVDLHWLASKKDNESEERVVGNLRLDQEGIQDTHPQSISGGTMLAVVYRYRGLRLTDLTISVSIR